MPADERATLERWVREYYRDNGFPDELWAMGFAEAVRFAAHFERRAREDAARIADNFVRDLQGGQIAAAIRASITTDEG